MTGINERPTRGVYAGAVDATAQSERMDVASQLLAEVVSYNGRTAELKVLYKPVFNGKEVDFPNLLEVPVDQPRAAGFALTFPIKAGDRGVVSFMGRDQDAFDKDGSAAAPSWARFHSYSDGRFTPGANPESNKMTNYDRDNVFLGTDDHKNGLRVTPGGTSSIEGNGESLYQIIVDALNTLINSEDVEGPGFTSGVRGNLQVCRDRLRKMMFR